MYPNQYYSSNPQYNNPNASYNNPNSSNKYEASYSSQGGSYAHQYQSQDNQDSQGSVPLSYPYGSHSYQHFGGMHQGTSVHHQQEYPNWDTQHYGTDQRVTDNSGHNHHGPRAHEWIEVPNTTTPKDIEPLIIEVVERGMKQFHCGWNGCQHPKGFVRKAQVTTHIKSVHLSEKPFVCTTCDASFTRKQDAIRHVDTMNSGKQFKCAFCDEGFARKDYRDRHCERCKHR